MTHEPHEFEVVVTVRKRIWVSGPTDREAAREMLTRAIPTMGCGLFAKRDATGRDIETLLSNEIELTDPAGEST